MKRLLLLAAICCSSIFGAATTIADNVSSVGNVVRDSIESMSISWNSFTAADSTPVTAGSTSVSLSGSGTFSVSLFPNTGTTGIYKVTYSGHKITYTETLDVPVSASSVVLQQCRVFGAILSASNGNYYLMPGVETASGSSSGVAGGDLTGNYPNPTVAKLLGNALPANSSGCLDNNGAGILAWVACSGSGSVWGGITGTLSAQGDLQTALNAKQATLTVGNFTEAVTNILTITGGTGSVIGSGLTVQVKQANGSQNGFLASGDWTTFNGKESPLTFSSPLLRTVNTVSLLLWGSGTRPVAASALGTSGNCVAWGAVGLTDTGSPCGSGGSGANALGTYLVQTATNAPANAQVLGLLSTGILKVTTSTGVVSIALAGDFPTLNQSTTGNAATATSATSFSGSLAGDVTGGQASTVVGKVNGISLSALATGILKNTTATGQPSIAIAADFPTLNQSTTGSSATATNVSGGTVGAVHYQSGVGATSFLSGNTAATDQVLVSHGTGSVAQAPTLGNAPALSAANMSSFPTLNQNTTGTSANITGNLLVGNLDSGTSASSSTFWRGDGTWATPAGAGTVTHTGGALTSTAIVTGAGGADIQTPSATSTIDGSGNISTPGTITATSGFASGGTTAGFLQLSQGTVNTCAVNALCFEAPASVATSTLFTYPSALPSGGQVISWGTPSAGVSTGTWVTPGGTGTVTSVGLTTPSWLTVGGSPVTSSGTLAVTATTAQTSHQVIGTCGSATTFAPCSLVAGDIPTLNQNTTGTASNITGNLAVANLNSGTSASSSTFWRGDGAWATPSSTVFQANGTGLTSSSTVNFQNSAATNGLTLGFSNPSVGNVQLLLTGTLTNAGLANSSVSYNGVTNSLGAASSNLGTLNDTNGNSTVLSSAVTSSVNQITVANAATGGTPAIAATGTDSNIPLTIQGKGTGQLNLNSTSAHADNAGNLTVASCTGCGGTTLNTLGSGWVAPFGDIAFQAAGAAFTANDTIAWQFVCCVGGSSITVATVGIPIFTAQAASHVAAAFYTGNLSPLVLVANTAGCASTSQGAAFCNLASSYTLNQGTVYWIVVSADTTSVALAEEGTSTVSLQTMLNQPSHAREGKCANAVSWSGGVPTWQSNCTGAGLTSLAGHRSPQIVFLP